MRPSSAACASTDGGWRGFGLEVGRIRVLMAVFGLRLFGLGRPCLWEGMRRDAEAWGGFVHWTPACRSDGVTGRRREVPYWTSLLATCKYLGTFAVGSALA